MRKSKKRKEVKLVRTTMKSTGEKKQKENEELLFKMLNKTMR